MNLEKKLSSKKVIMEPLFNKEQLKLIPLVTTHQSLISQPQPEIIHLPKNMPLGDGSNPLLLVM
jgi:hypothetical protein